MCIVRIHYHSACYTDIISSQNTVKIRCVCGFIISCRNQCFTASSQISADFCCIICGKIRCRTVDNDCFCIIRNCILLQQCQFFHRNIHFFQSRLEAAVQRRLPMSGDHIHLRLIVAGDITNGTRQLTFSIVSRFCLRVSRIIYGILIQIAGVYYLRFFSADCNDTSI